MHLPDLIHYCFFQKVQGRVHQWPGIETFFQAGLLDYTPLNAVFSADSLEYS